MTIALLVCVMPMAHVVAVTGGDAASSSAAQVRIFGDGAFIASGTLVDRNWVLTARHVVRPLDGRPAPQQLTMRFGSTNNSRDDGSNLRTIDHIVPHPDADLALLHFTEPLSPDTWIPRLATSAPRQNDPVRQYGWGPDGSVLRRLQVPVIDPTAVRNAAALRSAHPIFAVMFPAGVDPLVLDLYTDEADSGGGAFTTDGKLVGVHSALAPYEFVNGTGNLDGFAFPASYDQPVWTETATNWIRRIVNGEGSSSSSSPPAPPSTARQLTDQNSGGLPMTQPPQDHVCDPGDEACHQLDPAWLAGTLTGGGNHRGTALARCAAVGRNSCSFGGTTYAAGAQARLSLGPTSAPSAPGTRKVLIWCGTQTAFPDAGHPSRQVLRVSFTNGDDIASPVGYGWWDLTPDQVTGPDTNRPVDTARSNAC
ncbi:MAG TPA: S1 family peptidase [Kineosporiaceae bacterium]